MSKHTPGPWIHDTRGYPHPDVKSASGRNIACTWGVNGQPKTKEAYAAQIEISRANAHLIAAAPLMLEGLKKAKWMLERDYIDKQKMAVIEELDAIIESAEGEKE